MRKILALLAITAVFASCKKETVTAPVPAESKKLKQRIYTDNTGYSETAIAGYDVKGRMLTFVTDKFSYAFSYESDTRLVVNSKKTSDNTPLTTYECTLNNKGAISEILYKNQAGALTYTYQYTYDANNQMTGVKAFSPNGQGYEIVAQIVNGNIATLTHYSDGLPNGTSVFSYTDAKPNKMPHTLAANWPSATLFGKSNSLLPSEFKRFNTAGTATWHNTITYQYDADGYAIKENTNYLIDGTSSVTTYQYQ